MKLAIKGSTVYAYTGGKPFDASLPCVVFIHGAANDHSVWTLLARWFAHHGHGVLALDLPGHQRSDGPALRSVEAMADAVLALLDTAAVPRAALVGHSMGSLVALQLAARAPTRVSHLAMLGTAVPMAVPQALLDLARTDLAAAIHRVATFTCASWPSRLPSANPGLWLRGGAVSLMHQVVHAQGDSQLFHTDFSACHAYSQGLQAAQQVTCPSLLVLGERDQMTQPRQAHTVAQTLRAQVQHLPCGHALMQECPDELLRVLRTFLT